MKPERYTIRIRPINNCEGYFITDTGDVYSILGKGNRNKNKITRPYRLKPRRTNTGYQRVYLRDKNNKRKDFYIHRLVDEAFLDNPENKPCINHLDADRSNNYIENLEWATVKGNTDYTMKMNHLKRNKSTGRYEPGDNL